MTKPLNHQSAFREGAFLVQDKQGQNNAQSILRKYVSITAAVPFQKYIREISERTGQNSLASPEDVQLIHFQIQRSISSDGVQWSRFEPMELTTAFRVLEESIGSAPDLVDPIFTDPVITMPLPAKSGAGPNWGDEVTHPAIETVAEDDQKLMNLYLSELVRLFGKQQLASQRRKGFDDLQLSVRGMLKSLRDHGFTNEQIAESIAQAARTRGETALTEEWILRRLNPNPVNLLFRYLDFDVLSGWQYRYRFRVLVSHPKLEESSPELPATWSQFSEITDPVEVQ